MASLQISLLLLLLVLMLAPSSSGAQRNITLGSSLTTQGVSTSWPSPSGDFAFGFRPMDTNTSSYLLALWFDKTGDKAIVWYAKDGGRGVEVPSGSLLQLTSDGELSLRDPVNRELWSPQVSGAAYANMLDTGDFVLTGAGGSIIWDTFSNPVDTILPNQALHRGMELRSRLMPTDYTDGRFLLSVQVDGDLVFYITAALSGNPYSSYWDSGTAGTNGSRLVFNANGEIYFALTNGTRIRFTSVETSRGSMADCYHRATLDPDGVFRQYIYPKTAAASSRWNVGMWWTAVDLIPGNICDMVVTGEGSGVCGFNSYCRFDGKNRSQTAVDCQCPPRYAFIDPERKYKGCRADFQSQSCDLDETAASHQFDLLSMIDVDWPLADYEEYYPIDEDYCKKLCMMDCFCAVTVFHQGRCWKKKLPLSNGKADSTVERTLYLKVPKNNSSQSQLNYTGTSPKKRTRIHVIAGTSSLFGVCLFLLTFILWYKKYYGLLPCQRGPRNTPQIESFLQKQGTSHPKRYTYPEVRRMTNSFSHKLGQGGFGAVYRGKLPGGREIAVKILKDTKGDGEEFMNEVASISRTSHVNVVTLLGFCLQGSKRALIYEYMTNGSLERYTFGSNYAKDSSALSWERLFDIVLGIARGLEYLHRGCSTRIVHFDIKPQNILLDQDFCPKISDFGLAKLCKQIDSKISIGGARGTVGYIAPEVFSRQYGAVGSKSDVYGYGMVVLEMVGARKQIDVFTEEISGTYFPQWIYHNLDEFCGTTCDCEISSETTELVRKMTIVGLWCIQLTPTDRPSMSKVLDMLTSNSGDLQLPPKAS